MQLVIELDLQHEVEMLEWFDAWTFVDKMVYIHLKISGKFHWDQALKCIY